MSNIYHITSRQLYEASLATGIYTPPTFEQDGFIHLSQKHQVLGVANNFYKGQTGLVCLVIDPSKLRAELKYEGPVHPNGKEVEEFSASDKFPHLYGAMNLDAVILVAPMAANEQNVFVDLPE
jgi:uncharacterized protein (DUF952 family)